MKFYITSLYFNYEYASSYHILYTGSEDIYIDSKLLLCVNLIQFSNPLYDNCSGL
jgi:hypothetical protein